MKIKPKVPGMRLAARFLHLRGGVFLKTFLVLTTLSVAPIVSIALLFFSQSVQFWESENYTSNQRALEQFARTVDARLHELEQSCSQIANDPSVLSFILNPTFTEVSRNNLILKDLMSVTGGESCAGWAYVYSNYAGIVLSSEGKGYSYQQFYDQEGLSLYASGAWRGGPVERTIRQLHSGARQYVTVFRNVPERSCGSLGGVAFNIETGRLFSGIGQPGVFQVSVYGPDGGLLYSPDPSETAYQLEPEFKATLENANGAFTYRDGGGERVILHMASPATGWLYVGSAPLPLFYQGSRNISRNILKFSVVMLLICLIATFYMTRKLYSPLQSLVRMVAGPEGGAKPASNEYQYIQEAYRDVIQQNRSMADALYSMRPIVKSSLFMRLLLGEELSDGEAQERLAFIGDAFTIYGYGAMVLQIDHYHEYAGRFDEQHRNLHNLQLSSEIEKITGSIPHALVKTTRSAWALVLNTRDEALAHGVAEKIRECAQQRLPFTLTIGVGRAYQSIFDLAQSYREAQDLLRYKLYKGVNNIYDTHTDEDAAQRQVYFLDSKLDAALLLAVRTGDLAAVSGTCASIFGQMQQSKASCNDILLTCTHLVNRVLELLISLGLDVGEVFGRRDFYERLATAETAEEMRSQVERACLLAAERIDRRNKERSGQNVERMTEYIEAHLGEDISLRDLAGYMGMSAAYVSRFFKERLGVGFVEYLNRNRIARAKRLLEETQMAVDQVGFQVGFNNVRSFMRTFKQYEGSSPGQYRSAFLKRDDESAP